MLSGAGAAGIEGVEIHLAVVGDVAADHRALDEMDIVEPVGDAGGVEKILHRGIAVAAGCDIDQRHRRTSGAVMDRSTAKREIMGLVAAVEGKRFGRQRQHVLDQRAGKTQAAILAQLGPGRCHDLNARARRVGQADLLERVKRGGVDALHAGFAQGAVEAADEPRAHRALVAGKRCGAQGVAGGAAAGAAGETFVHADCPVRREATSLIDVGSIPGARAPPGRAPHR